jgi:hypothetical protein
MCSPARSRCGWSGRSGSLPRDCVFVPPGVVHGAFNAGQDGARGLPILGPSVGGMGIEIVDGSGKAPWRNKRMVPFATPRINRRQRACFRFYKRSSRKQASCTRNVFKGHQAEVNQVSALAANADVPEERGNYRA